MMVINKKTWAVLALAVIFILSGSLYSYFRQKNLKNEVVVYNYEKPVTETQTVNIKIYITGEVSNPGTYELWQGARIEDALEAAGGASENADLNRINLAAYIKDAQQIIVPSVNETSNTSGEPSAESGGLININRASTEELMRLPSIGEVIAGNIIKYREENGDFKSINEIKNVSRIGEKTFEGIKDFITID